MGIINANEPDTSNLSDTPIGLYYYYIDKAKINEASINISHIKFITTHEAG